LVTPLVPASAGRFTRTDAMPKKPRVSKEHFAEICELIADGKTANGHLHS